MIFQGGGVPLPSPKPLFSRRQGRYLPQMGYMDGVDIKIKWPDRIATEKHVPECLLAIKQSGIITGDDVVMFKRKYVDDTVLVDAYKKYGTEQAAALELGCSYETVRRALIRNGIERTGRKHNGPIAGVRAGGCKHKITNDELVKCSKSMTVEDICKKYSMHYTTVLSRMKRLNIIPAFSGDYRDHYKWRAEFYNVEYDKNITLESIIARDKGICKICGKPVDCSNRLLCPTIDHIIPMSKGGGHTWSNSQLAHFICNCRKRDLVDQKITEVK